MKTIYLTLIFLIASATVFAQWNDIGPNPPHNVGVMYMCHFANKDFGYIGVSDINKNQVLYNTINSGNDWSYLSNHSFQNFIFYSKDTAVLNTRDTFWLTTNGFDSVEHVHTFESRLVLSHNPLSRGRGNDVFISFDKSYYAPDSVGTYKSSDLGRTWEKVSDTSITRITFINDSVGYGSGSFNSPSGNYLVKSTDFGKSWKTIQGKFSGDFAFSDTFYYTSGGSILVRSFDEGKTYKNIIGNFPSSFYINCYTFISARTGFAYSQYDGLYSTTDAGETWKQLWSQAPHPFNQIQCFQKDQKVYFVLSEVGSSGIPNIYYGTYDSTDIWTTGIQEKANPRTKFQIYPNLTKNNLTITYTGFIASGTRARLYDMQGKLVKEQALRPGKTTMGIGGLQKGMYLLKVNTGEGEFVEKVVKE